MIKNIFFSYQKEIENNMDIDSWLSDNCPEDISEFPKLKKIFGSILLVRNYQNIKTDDAWKKIYVKRNNPKNRYLPILKYAVSVLILIAFSLFIHKNLYYNGHNEINVPPGEDKAILRLSTGEEIFFDKTDKGAFTNGDGYKIGFNIANTVILNAINDENEFSEYNTFIVPIGGVYRLVLNDGSKIVLNSGSKLKYSGSFGYKERTVELNGEAYFEVMPDKTKPFVIKTDHTEVTVLGTSLNVCSYTDDDFEQITLVTGSVEIACDGQKYDIKKGMQLERKPGDISARYVDTSLFTSWHDGLFSFENMRLDEIMVKLARWYDIDFRFQDEICKASRFSGAIERDANLNEFIKLIERTTKVRFEIDDKTIIISKK